MRSECVDKILVALSYELYLDHEFKQPSFFLTEISAANEDVNKTFKELVHSLQDSELVDKLFDFEEKSQFANSLEARSWFIAGCLAIFKAISKD